MKKPLVSIIIPAYNEEKRIAGALESARRQSYSGRIETIVVANACTDDTANVSRGYSDKVIETPAQGICHAKNLGISQAEGDVIAFLDADSHMKEDLIEKAHLALTQGFNCGKAALQPLDDPRLRAKIQCSQANLLNYLASNFKYLDPDSGAFMFSTHDLIDKITKEYGECFDTNLRVMTDISFIKRAKKLGHYKFIRDSCVYTSMRRFLEEGYLKWQFLDAYHGLFPKGKTRKRWDKK